MDALLHAVRAEGYTVPTPIQQQAIPPVLTGRDVLGCAQTGTGKTAAFALPILQRLHNSTRFESPRKIRALVLSPTRELAAQIGDSFAAYGRHLSLKHTVIFGGVGQQPQTDALKRGVDVLVATPGRLLDLMGQGLVRLNDVEVFVLDEADRMLDMGFIHDVRRVITALPKQRQTLLFSATMPADIQQLANDILIEPVYVEVTPQATTVERIDQQVFFVETRDKPALLRQLLSDKSVERVLVFSRTKHGANKVVKQLDQSNIGAEAIHGNKSQTAREAALEHFKTGETRVLVATDIAARGIDVEGITHVINYDLPNEPETYVHRIGRTARAGADGIAYSFCAEEERPYLRDIERLIRQHIPVVKEHAFQSPLGLPQTTDLNGRGGQRAPSPRQLAQAERRTDMSEMRRISVAPRMEREGGNGRDGNRSQSGRPERRSNNQTDNRTERPSGERPERRNEARPNAPRSAENRDGQRRDARPSGGQPNGDRRNDGRPERRRYDDDVSRDEGVASIRFVSGGVKPEPKYKSAAEYVDALMAEAEKNPPTPQPSTPPPTREARPTNRPPAPRNSDGSGSSEEGAPARKRRRRRGGAKNRKPTPTV